jgi:endonuclease/exonuclease/phosphatase family metal-dependent hydrolase
MRIEPAALVLIATTGLWACAGDDPQPPPAEPEPELCKRQAQLDSIPAPESYQYDWTCSGSVPAAGEALPTTEVGDDCTIGVWPDLDDTVDICPTVSEAVRTDPVSGLELPSDDPRPLPLDIPVSEAGSFLPPSLPASWPSTLRVVAWNLEYTSHLDEQIDVLTTHPELSTADLYLLSEVDRCSSRNDKRRAARLMAEALEAAYVYGIEFVELEIDRDVGGDTGQAIISRRPLSSAALTCHSNHFDWFASADEPRLGQRVALHADLPVGDQSVRVYAIHLESNDIFGDLRSIQSKELLDAAQARACERPQIIGGDFNAPYCGAPELDVLRGADFADAIGMAGHTEPTHQNGMRLDYVWTRGFRIIDGGVVTDLGVSDHDALWVDLELE